MIDIVFKRMQIDRQIAILCNYTNFKHYNKGIPRNSLFNDEGEAIWKLSKVFPPLVCNIIVPASVYILF